MTKQLVSVIIPAYKAENVILEALMSVKAQTYLAWEIIVVEDACKDKTEEIVREFAKDVGGRQIKYLCHEQNKGVSETRNTAIKHAQGDYLAFLDHDDIWQENHLEAAITKLESESGDFAYSTVQMFEDRTNKRLGSWGPKQQDIENFPTSLFARNYIQPSTVVMRQGIPKIVGFFDSSLRKVEDLDYWLRVAEAGFKFVYVEGIYCLYRKNNSLALTADIESILEAHTIVLRKHHDLSIIPLATRRYISARYHLGVAKRNLKTNRKKALKFFITAWNISPRVSVIAIVSVILEKLGIKSSNHN